eukprot:jgi/Mesvir1/17959/Mv25372-RA.2
MARISPRVIYMGFLVLASIIAVIVVYDVIVVVNNRRGMPPWGGSHEKSNYDFMDQQGIVEEGSGRLHVTPKKDSIAARMGSETQEQFMREVFGEDGIPVEEVLYFASIGDWGVGTAAQADVAVALGAYVRRYNAEFIISLGDNFYVGGVRSTEDRLWRDRFENVYTRERGFSNQRWYSCLGDHDHVGNVTAQIARTAISDVWHMPSHYYSEIIPVGTSATLQLVVIDSVALEGVWSSGKQRRFWENLKPEYTSKPVADSHLAWLEETLRDSTADWLVVVGHRPVVSGCTRGRSPSESTYMDNLRPLLARHRVDLYLNGHDHTAQHLVDVPEDVAPLLASTHQPPHVQPHPGSGAGMAKGITAKQGEVVTVAERARAAGMDLTALPEVTPSMGLFCTS